MLTRSVLMTDVCLVLLCFCHQIQECINTKAQVFLSIVNICILPAYLNLNVNADGGAEWSLLWFRSIPDEFFVLDSNLEQTSYAARVKVNEGRCPAEIEHPLRNLLKKKKETFASESYFEMNPPAQYPRIALIRDVTDTNVIKLLLES